MRLFCPILMCRWPGGSPPANVSFNEVSRSWWNWFTFRRAEEVATEVKLMGPHVAVPVGALPIDSTLPASHISDASPNKSPPPSRPPIPGLSNGPVGNAVRPGAAPIDAARQNGNSQTLMEGSAAPLGVDTHASRYQGGAQPPVVPPHAAAIGRRRAQPSGHSSGLTLRPTATPTGRDLEPHRSTGEGLTLPVKAAPEPPPDDAGGPSSFLSVAASPRVAAPNRPQPPLRPLPPTPAGIMPPENPGPIEPRWRPWGPSFPPGPATPFNPSRPHDGPLHVPPITKMPSATAPSHAAQPVTPKMPAEPLGRFPSRGSSLPPTTPASNSRATGRDQTALARHSRKQKRVTPTRPPKEKVPPQPPRSVKRPWEPLSAKSGSPRPWASSTIPRLPDYRPVPLNEYFLLDGTPLSEKYTPEPIQPPPGDRAAAPAEEVKLKPISFDAAVELGMSSAAKESRRQRQADEERHRRERAEAEAERQHREQAEAEAERQHRQQAEAEAERHRRERAESEAERQRRERAEAARQSRERAEAERQSRLEWLRAEQDPKKVLTEIKAEDCGGRSDLEWYDALRARYRVLQPRQPLCAEEAKRLRDQRTTRTLAAEDEAFARQQEQLRGWKAKRRDT